MSRVEEAGTAYAAARDDFDAAQEIANHAEGKRVRNAYYGTRISTEREWMKFANATKKRDAALAELLAAVEELEGEA